MISGFDDKHSFAKVLHEHLSPTTPIQSPEHLFGRTKQTQLIEQALYAPGRSIFIYGDRGVGKTSLGLTVAYSHQSSSGDPLKRVCEPDTTFGSLMTSVVNGLEGQKKPQGARSFAGKLGVTAAGYGVEVSGSHKKDGLQSISNSDLNTVVNSLLNAAKVHKEETVVLIDEFDRIASDLERTRFADFIKQIGDQSIPIKFVFCGVGDSLTKLLGSHESSFRYLESVPVPRLGHEARFEIMDRASAAFQVSLDDRYRYRIAAISDGFPYYVHLLCEKIFWEMVNDPLIVTTATSAHYQQAVAASVSGIEPHLKTTYDKAVMREAVGYEDVLWAVADHADLKRKTEDIYASYEKLFGDDPNKLDRSKVVTRLNALKGISCGRILASERVGYYHFSESMMRGYVRLRAEEQGYELATDFSCGPSTSPTFPQRGARKSRSGVSRSDWRRTDIPTD
jgi:hypothetical protein